MLIGSLAAAWWAIGVGILLASVFGALLQPRIQRGREKASVKPPMSVILPVKLVNAGFDQAQSSVFWQVYPDYEILVAAADETTPAMTFMQTLIARSRVPARFVRSIEVRAVSPKLDNIGAGLASATHDVVVTKDSNISFATETLEVMARGLTPGVGLVCAVPVAFRAETFAGRIEAILINRDARLLLTASATGKGYGVGKVTAFRRSDLERAGGLAAISYTIAEDTALSRVLGKIGLTTVFADATVAQEIGAVSFRDVYARQARWAVIRRAEEPKTFLFEPLACPVPAALAGALAASLAGLPSAAVLAGTLAGWYALEVVVAAVKGWELRPWTPLAFLGRDAVLLTAWARAWTTREVVWAGARRKVSDVMRAPRG